MKTKNRMAIIASYFENESYGLLGPQIAATIIEDNTDYECIVIAVTRNDDKSLIKKFLDEYFGKEKKIIGFSSLSGREDLFSFSRELKNEGAITILAGPQSYPDYIGETGWKEHLHRFKGFSGSFSFSIKGPAEQAILLLNDIENQDQWLSSPGVTLISPDFRIVSNSAKAWNEEFLRTVKWNNLYRIGKEGIMPIKITVAQVVQQIGCPYAGRGHDIHIDYPADLKAPNNEKISIFSKGCSFCDVAADKGFYGELGMDTVLSQISALPEQEDGRKIPFELINENPLFTLPVLLKEVKQNKIRLSQVNLILRADYFIRGETRLRESLLIARETGTRILLSSMGFEAFDDNLLRNFNKGTDVETNLRAIRLMRDMKKQFADTWSYSRSDGAIHGFIHPTPWDTGEIFSNTQANIAAYGLERDILPPHSTPLIIHHACALGDWIREIEEREGIKYRRLGSIIEWWKYE
ncbi:MAG: hypothetical protein JW944_04855 [Deltaproteobacteria bacterium]|nr:hypothetical protein [Deltaproteobacteria bacterium]